MKFLCRFLLTFVPPLAGSLALLAQDPGQVMFSDLTGGVVYGAPAIGPTGEIVFGSRDKNVYALNHDGSLRWDFEGSTDWIEASPVIAADGTVYVGSWDQHLYAINGNDGSLKWKFATGSIISASVALLADGNIVCASEDGFLYGVSPEGEMKWFYYAAANLFDAYSASPVVAADGYTVVIGNESGHVHAVDGRDGSLQWTFSILATDPLPADSVGVVAAAAIGPDGAIFVPSKDGKLYALSSSGSLLWSYAAAESISSSPIISADYRILFASHDGYLYQIDREGFQVAETFVGDVFKCTPAIDSAGSVIIAGYAGSTESGIATRIVSVAADGSFDWELVLPTLNDSSPNIAPDGSVYIGAHDNTLYKIAHRHRLADGYWPRLMAGMRQTGKQADISQPTLVDFTPNLIPTGDGWHGAAKLGELLLDAVPLPWAFHRDHGVIYLSTAASYQATSYWFFHPGLQDWLAAHPDSPQFLFRAATNSWMFHFYGTINGTEGRWLYDYFSHSWLLPQL